MIFRGFLVLLVLVPFGWAAQKPQTVEMRPRIVERVMPEYPPDLRAQRVIGSVRLLCTVDEAGRPGDIRVVGQSQPAFGAAAKAALKQCRYQPGTRNGQPTAMESEVEMEFMLTDSDLAKMEAERVLEVVPPGPPLIEAYQVSVMPELKKEIRPNLPAGLENGRIENTVVRLFVDEEGLPRDVHVLVTTAPGCGIAAVEAVRNWRFSPGKRDGLPVRVNMEVPIAFFAGDRWSTGARIKPGVSRDIVSALPGAEIVFSTKATTPKIEHREELDYPTAMSDVMSGSVTMECIINPYGVVTHVRAIDTTNQYFTIAAERAFSRWRFTPPRVGGRPVYLRARMTATFVRH